MVEFNSKIDLMDLGPEVGVAVIDANLQGVIEYKGFEKAYPKAFQQYLKTCLFNHKNKVGDVLIVEEENKKVAILFTSKKRDEKHEILIENFKSSLAKLFQILPSDVFIYSPILGRKLKLAKQYFDTIKSVEALTKEKSRVWRVCTKRN